MISFLKGLETLREDLAPVFQEIRNIWEREGPAAMARAEALGITIESKGGNCPVQAEGMFDDRRFYFRARHDEWSLTVWQGGEGYSKALGPFWEVEREYDGINAGWMPLHEAVGFICDAVTLYRTTPPAAQSEGGET